MNKTTFEKELTVLYVGPNTFIGVDELSNNRKFSEGTLLVESDEVTLCYISKHLFLTSISEKEITRLLRSESDCIKYPKDEAILVKKRGNQEMKQLRSNFLLDATGRNH